MLERDDLFKGSTVFYRLVLVLGLRRNVANTVAGSRSLPGGISLCWRSARRMAVYQALLTESVLLAGLGGVLISLRVWGKAALVACSDPHTGCYQPA